MRLADINTDNRYKVEGYGGVAFYFAGAQTETFTEWDYVGPEGGDYNDPDNFAYDEQERLTGMVYMIMVGDDHKHVIDPEDVTIIDPDAYCHECGQIGCTHDGR